MRLNTENPTCHPASKKADHMLRALVSLEKPASRLTRASELPTDSVRICSANQRAVSHWCKLIAAIWLVIVVSSHGLIASERVDLEGSKTSQASAVEKRRFEAEGTVNWFFGNALPENQNREDRTTSFKIRVDGCRWLMTVRSSSPGLPGIKTVGSDGKDVYVSELLNVQEMRPSPDQDTNSLAWKAQIESMREGLLPMPAEVWPGPRPEFDWKDSHWLWLAFASSCYLKELLTNRLPLKFLMFSPYVASDTAAVRFSWDDSDPGLLLLFQWLDDGSENLGHGKLWNWPPPFDKGFTRFEYRVEHVNQLGDSSVPTAFKMVLYAPQLGATNWMGISRYAEGQVTSLRQLRGHESGRPALHGLTIVRDYRGRSAFGVEVVQYKTRSDWWQTNETRFSRAAHGIIEDESGPSLPIVAGTALVILAACYPLMAWVIRRQMKKKQTNAT